MYAVQGTPPTTGLPGAQSSSGLPVFGVDLGGDGLPDRLAGAPTPSGSPPGISDGPKRAPSSPPETPEPKKRQLVGVLLLAADGVGPQALPQSTTMSSLSTPAPRSCSMTASTGAPALTRMMILRGFLSAATKSGSAAVPTSPPGVFAVRGDELLHDGGRAVVDRDAKPWSAMLRARFWPMTARPISPTSAPARAPVVMGSLYRNSADASPACPSRPPGILPDRRTPPRP